MATNHKIFWCGDPQRAAELAAFFAANVQPAYISHSELQGDRALGPSEWRDGLPELLRREIEPRLHDTRDGAPPITSRPVMVIEEDGALAALALVTFAGEQPVPFAVIEDLVVASAGRGHGIGKAAMDWIAAESMARDIRRLFLESGKDNHRAHHFFEREGFEICSVVMMRSLAGDC
jgi:ribosomal protein S18 acetylase RimI-like enzyme